MGTETKIDERRVVDVVNADRFAGLLVDQLTLQRLVALLENPQSFGFRYLIAPVGKIAAGNLSHSLLNQGKVRLGERLGSNNIVEETITRIVKQRWANSQLRSGKQIKHGSSK